VVLAHLRFNCASLHQRHEEVVHDDAAAPLELVLVPLVLAVEHIFEADIVNLAVAKTPDGRAHAVDVAVVLPCAEDVLERTKRRSGLERVLQERARVSRRSEKGGKAELNLPSMTSVRPCKLSRVLRSADSLAGMNFITVVFETS